MRGENVLQIRASDHLARSLGEFIRHWETSWGLVIHHYLFTHSFTVLSAPALAINFPSDETATAYTGPVFCVKARLEEPPIASASQRSTEVSAPPLIIDSP